MGLVTQTQVLQHGSQASQGAFELLCQAPVCSNISTEGTFKLGDMKDEEEMAKGKSLKRLKKKIGGIQRCFELLTMKLCSIA